MRVAGALGKEPASDWGLIRVYCVEEEEQEEEEEVGERVDDMKT